MQRESGACRLDVPHALLAELRSVKDNETKTFSLTPLDFSSRTLFFLFISSFVLPLRGEIINRIHEELAKAQTRGLERDAVTKSSAPSAGGVGAGLNNHQSSSFDPPSENSPPPHQNKLTVL